MLLLLGDQLIRDPAIAVFELVKNAYDADSPRATVTMSRIEDPSHGQIVVQDSGTGMDYDTITDVWLEPGTDYRARQRESGERTPKFGRLPLGEKGVGRFAAHKLGSNVRLITRKHDFPEVVVEINWDDFNKHEYLDEVPVKVEERTPEVFTGAKTGTRIEIGKLRNVWTRGMVRDLARSVTSICSPFSKEGEFRAELKLTENEAWLEGLLTVDQVLKYALFHATCDIKDHSLTYDYEFRPYPAMDRVTGRKVHCGVSEAMNVTPEENDRRLIGREIGPIHLDLYIYDREPAILSLGVTDRRGLKEFLDVAGGIRVYRDDIRVYDYGEPENDWLNLGGERVNVPTKRVSNNIVVGAVTLDAERSSGLVEKTNREGFVGNEAYRVFRTAVAFAITQIASERNEDKKRIRNEYSPKKSREPVMQDLAEVRELVEKKSLTHDLGPYLDRIEEDYIVIRDRFLTSASAGLSLSVVIHEVEKGVKELTLAVKEDEASPRIQRLAKHLADLVEGFAALIRRSGMSYEKASSLVAKALFNTQLRLRVHHIEAIVNTDHYDFEAKCSRRLTISTLMNLIDNSIYWLDNKWGVGGEKKQIYIGTSNELSGGPAIVVADNGPGFRDPPEYLIEPFMSRKPDGMGLGLHIADQVMKAQGGRLVFSEPDDLSLPKGFDGAVVALVFGGKVR